MNFAHMQWGDCRIAVDKTHSSNCRAQGEFPTQYLLVNTRGCTCLCAMQHVHEWLHGGGDLPRHARLYWHGPERRLGKFTHTPNGSRDARHHIPHLWSGLTCAHSHPAVHGVGRYKDAGVSGMYRNQRSRVQPTREEEGRGGGGGRQVLLDGVNERGCATTLVVVAWAHLVDVGVKHAAAREEMGVRGGNDGVERAHFCGFAQQQSQLGWAERVRLTMWERRH